MRLQTCCRRFFTRLLYALAFFDMQAAEPDVLNSQLEKLLLIGQKRQRIHYRLGHARYCFPPGFPEEEGTAREHRITKEALWRLGAALPVRQRVGLTASLLGTAVSGGVWLSVLREFGLHVAISVTERAGKPVYLVGATGPAKCSGKQLGRFLNQTS